MVRDRPLKTVAQSPRAPTARRARPAGGRSGASAPHRSPAARPAPRGGRRRRQQRCLTIHPAGPDLAVAHHRRSSLPMVIAASLVTAPRSAVASVAATGRCRTWIKGRGTAGVRRDRLRPPVPAVACAEGAAIGPPDRVKDSGRPHVATASMCRQCGAVGSGEGSDDTRSAMASNARDGAPRPKITSPGNRRPVRRVRSPRSHRHRKRSPHRCSARPRSGRERRPATPGRRRRGRGPAAAPGAFAVR